MNSETENNQPKDDVAQNASIGNSAVANPAVNPAPPVATETLPISGQPEAVKRSGTKSAEKESQANAGNAPSATATPPVTPPPAPYVDPRRRLRELLAVPERDRSDAQWDEINELEIQLAPGNRINPNHPVGGAEKSGGQARSFQQKKHPPKAGGGNSTGGSNTGGGGNNKPRRPRPNQNNNNPNKAPQ